MRKILPYIIFISAFAVSGSAAFYSVYGLSKIFAGAGMAVVIMAASLELSKLVTATALKWYWVEFPKWLRNYLVVAVATLVIITSSGIYGFLSNAYKVTANADEINSIELQLIENKIINFETRLADIRIEQESNTNDITSLRQSLGSGNQVQYIDKNTGQLITTTSAATRNSIIKQLDDAIERRNQLDINFQSLSDSVSFYRINGIEKKSENNSSSELESLRYISILLDKPMDQVVNWFLLLLIFVFDPLAIALVLAANFAIGKIRESKPKQPESIKVTVEPDVGVEEDEEDEEDEDEDEEEEEEEDKDEEEPLQEATDKLKQMINEALPGYLKDDRPNIGKNQRNAAHEQYGD